MLGHTYGNQNQTYATDFILICGVVMCFFFVFLFIFIMVKFPPDFAGGSGCQLHRQCVAIAHDTAFWAHGAEARWEGRDPGNEGGENQVAEEWATV